MHAVFGRFDSGSERGSEGGLVLLGVALSGKLVPIPWAASGRNYRFGDARGKLSCLWMLSGDEIEL